MPVSDRDNLLGMALHCLGTSKSKTCHGVNKITT